jgi:hypothetical protein
VGNDQPQPGAILWHIIQGENTRKPVLNPHERVVRETLEYIRCMVYTPADIWHEKKLLSGPGSRPGSDNGAISGICRKQFLSLAPPND